MIVHSATDFFDLDQSSGSQIFSSTFKEMMAVFIPRAWAIARFNSKTLAHSKGLFIVIWFYFFNLSLCSVYWPSEHRKKEQFAHPGKMAQLVGA